MQHTNTPTTRLSSFQPGCCVAVYFCPLPGFFAYSGKLAFFLFPSFFFKEFPTAALAFSIYNKQHILLQHSPRMQLYDVTQFTW